MDAKDFTEVKDWCTLSYLLVHVVSIPAKQAIDGQKT
jgi:hypothetical protein